MKLMTVSSTVSLILLLQLVSIAVAVCPNVDEIKPCTCDDEGLQCLKLNNTGLDRVFKASADRKAIRRVWIFQTNLTSLKKRAFGDYIIRDLFLDLNQISRVEAGAFGEAAKTLQSLSLTRNLLKTYPFEDLKNMKKLKQLGLGHNKFARIPAKAFPESESIESIDFSHNQIEKIEPYALAELHGVNLIDLSRNLLREIEAKALVVKSSERHLGISLRGNRISKISIDAFGDHHPNSIDLSRNKLVYLDKYVFEPLLMNDTFINVGENPLSCYGCDLYKWLLELDKEYLNNLDNFSCIDDTRLDDLTLESIGCN